MSVEIKGIEDLFERLDIAASGEGIENGLAQACALVEGRAKANAPKGNGDLRRSITSKVENGGSNLIGVVYTPLEYAPYVEYGTGLFAEDGGRTDVPWRYQDDRGEWHTTSGMKPHPYMRPALNECRAQILKILKGELLK